MKTFEARLKSPETGQSRIISLAAADAAAARAELERRELAIVNFSLLPPEREVWEEPPGGEHDENGLVDLSRWDAYDPVFARRAAALPYAEAVSAATFRLNDFRSRVDIHDGKIRGKAVGPRTAGRLLNHLQREPYEVVELEEVTKAAEEFAAAGVEGMRELVLLARKLQAENDPRWDPTGWARIFEALREMGAPLNAVTAAIHGVAVLAHDHGGTPIVWGTGTGGNGIFVALLTAYSANVDTHDFWNDVSSTEIANGNGYTTNGVELAGKLVSYDTATDQTRLDGDDVSWASSTISATDAAIVNRTPGADSSREVYGSIDFGATVSTTSGTFQITWDATGIIVRDYT
jgi:hypothetical protein